MTTSTPVLSDTAARALAAYWLDEDDDGAPSTVLARTGAISDETIRVLARDLRLLEAAAGSQGLASSAQSQLRALLDYVRDHGPRGPVEGWTSLLDV